MGKSTKKYPIKCKLIKSLWAVYLAGLPEKRQHANANLICPQIFTVYLIGFQHTLLTAPQNRHVQSNQSNELESAVMDSALVKKITFEAAVDNFNNYYY